MISLSVVKKLCKVLPLCKSSRQLLCRCPVVSKPLAPHQKFPGFRVYSSQKEVPNNDGSIQSESLESQKEKNYYKGWIPLALIGAALGGLAYYMESMRKEMQEAEECGDNQGYGIPDLGGPFELVNTEGITVTQDDFLGKWILVYFGFCHCPDICPDVLERLTNAIKEVNSTKGLPHLHPIFVTVDPLRDTKEVIKEYLKDFHPEFIGLTGTEEQIKKACKSYRVYCTLGPKDEDGDYIVDHTIITYLMDPDGKYSDYFNKHKTSEDIVKSVKRRMRQRMENEGHSG